MDEGTGALSVSVGPSMVWGEPSGQAGEDWVGAVGGLGGAECEGTVSTAGAP